MKEGETTNDLFASLTCAPNAEAAAIQPRAKPVILTAPAEWQLWLTAPRGDARELQPPWLNGRCD